MQNFASGNNSGGPSGPAFTETPIHRQWLLDQASKIYAFFQPASYNPAGGFHGLDFDGRPIVPESNNGDIREIHSTARMVHCAVIAHHLGVSGADRIVDHGMQFLWNRHRDHKRGGYFWGADDTSAAIPTKNVYGHAFVLLAAASAKTMGHPDADRLLNDATSILLNRFWDAEVGAATEEYDADWNEIGNYRGQNSNMHLTEALMSACEVTGDRRYLEMAQSIANLIINVHARAEDWRVPEHFDNNWRVDRDYAGNPIFRPSGTTPGHALEWSRLLIQLWELGKRQDDWMPEAAQNLFLTACETGWDEGSGGFFYTLNWDDTPAKRDRYWWPCCEGLAAASALFKSSRDAQFELWYRRIFSFIKHNFVDHRRGGWYPELDAYLKPVERVFRGKPDLYHAFQACLIPLLTTDGSLCHQLQITDNQSVLKLK
jgi:sulfoquinovose isomerase